MIERNPYELDHALYRALSDNDRWIYNRLEIANRLGHLSGDAQTPIPINGDYILRQIQKLGVCASSIQTSAHSVLREFGLTVMGR